MACDSCMESHDFLHLYQLHTAPTTVTREGDQSGTDITSPSLQITEDSKTDSKNGTETDSKNGIKTDSENRIETDSKNGNDTAASYSEAKVHSGSENTSNGAACELRRRKALADQSAIPLGSNGRKGAGYFDKGWRSQLCSCPACNVRRGRGSIINCLALMLTIIIHNT